MDVNSRGKCDDSKDLPDEEIWRTGPRPPEGPIAAKKWAQHQSFVRGVSDPMDQEKRLDEQTVSEQVGHFAETFSAHGFGRIYMSKRWTRRSLWIILTIFMIAFGTYQCYKVVAEYLTYPKKVTIGVEEEMVVEFPAVTVCNLNPLATKHLLTEHPIWGAFVDIEDKNKVPVCEGLADTDPDTYDYEMDMSEYYEYYGKEDGWEEEGEEEYVDGDTEDGQKGITAAKRRKRNALHRKREVTEIDTETLSALKENKKNGGETGRNEPPRYEEGMHKKQGPATNQRLGNGHLKDKMTKVTKNKRHEEEKEDSEKKMIQNKLEKIRNKEQRDIVNEEKNLRDTKKQQNFLDETPTPLKDDRRQPKYTHKQPPANRWKKQTTNKEKQRWLEGETASTTPFSSDEMMDFNTFTKVNKDKFMVYSSPQDNLHRQRRAATSNTSTTKLTKSQVTKIRNECSLIYRFLSYMKKENSQGTVDGVSTVPKLDINCSIKNYKENVTFNPVCGLEVLCDNFGCIDYYLRAYKEKIKVDENSGNITRCPSCADECWPDVWFVDYELGFLSTDQVSYMLARSRSPDLSDVLELYKPNADDIRNYSIPPQDFIETCTFDRTACSYKHFYTWASDHFGQCYTFNSALRNVTLKNGKIVKALPRKTSLSGPANGLRLTLSIHASQYLSLLSPDLGARVIIHSPHSIPFPEDEGFNVSPGVSVSVLVSRKKLSRVGFPYGSCKEGSSKRFQYTPVACKKQCIEKEYWNFCGCYVGQSPAYEDIDKDNKPAKQCSPFNLTQKLCTASVVFSYQRQAVKCDCPPPCKETHYMTQVTSSEENRHFYTIIQNLKRSEMSEDICSGFENETVRIQIYLDSLSHEVLTESPAYTWDTLISNVGGNFGLFIGMSLVTLIELIEFLIDVTFVIYANRNKKKSRSKVKKARKAKRKNSELVIDRMAYNPPTSTVPCWYSG